jgi:uncharacterized protein YecE (DUF72 family)
MTDLGLDSLPSNVLVGTSSWSCPDWDGVFYPRGTASRDYITHYASLLPTVEIDATFYRAPAVRTVQQWAAKTPPGFVFAAKVPQAITHERGLVDCESETRAFLDTMSHLGEKLGPLILQFAYVAKRKDEREYRTGASFRGRLAGYLKTLPPEFRFAVEIRNATWLDGELTDLLRAHGVGLVLSDYYTMPRLDQLERKLDPLTGDFVVVRFIGHRQRMDKLIAELQAKGKARAFDELVVDRSAEMDSWVPALQRLAPRVSRMFAYFNNHYAGYAPGSVSLFARTWGQARSA